MIEHVELVVNSVESPYNSCIIDVQIVESSQVEFPIKFGIGLDENWVFGVKNRTSRQKPVMVRHGELQRDREQCLLVIHSPRRIMCNREQCLLAFSSPLRVSCPRGVLFSSSAPFSCSCVVFTRFCFGIAFSTNMKVLGSIVSFSNGLVCHD